MLDSNSTTDNSNSALDLDSDVNALSCFNDIDKFREMWTARNDLEAVLLGIIEIYREADRDPNAEIPDALDDTLAEIRRTAEAFGVDPERFAPDTDPDTDANADANADVMADGGFVTNAPTQTAIRGIDPDTGATEWVDLDGEPIANADQDQDQDGEANAGVIPQGVLIKADDEPAYLEPDGTLRRPDGTLIDQDQDANADADAESYAAPTPPKTPHKGSRMQGFCFKGVSGDGDDDGNSDEEGASGTDLSALQTEGPGAPTLQSHKGQERSTEGLPSAGSMNAYRSANEIAYEAPQSVSSLTEIREENARRVRVLDDDDPRHDPDVTMTKRVYAINYDGRDPSPTEQRAVDEVLRGVSKHEDRDAPPVVLMDPDEYDDHAMARQRADIIARVI